MVGSSAGLDGSAAPTETQRIPRFQRRPLGIPWLLGLLVVPLLLAAIDNSVFKRPQSVTGPTGDLPTLTTARATSAPSRCTGLQDSINTVMDGPIPFGNDEVDLNQAVSQILSRVADKLKVCPNARVRINGYTDSTGSEGINIELSTQHAALVADFLVAHGVARHLVSTEGLGSMNPIASNDTPEGRFQNRRAEIVVS